VTYSGVCVYYCSTYYKAVREGGEYSGWHEIACEFLNASAVLQAMCRVSVVCTSVSPKIPEYVSAALVLYTSVCPASIRAFLLDLHFPASTTSPPRCPVFLESVSTTFSHPRWPVHEPLIPLKSRLLDDVRFDPNDEVSCQKKVRNLNRKDLMMYTEDFGKRFRFRGCAFAKIQESPGRKVGLSHVQIV